MDALYLLIPLSLLLVLAIGGVMVWASLSGQFDRLEREGQRILEESPDGARRADSGAGPPADRQPH